MKTTKLLLLGALTLVSATLSLAQPSGGPAGAHCADLPRTIRLDGTAHAVSGILFPRDTAPGTYTVTFTGVSGSLTNSATAQFTVE